MRADKAQNALRVLRRSNFSSSQWGRRNSAHTERLQRSWVSLGITSRGSQAGHALDAWKQQQDPDWEAPGRIVLEVKLECTAAGGTLLKYAALWLATIYWQGR